LGSGIRYSGSGIKKAPDHGSRIRIRNTGDLINFCVSTKLINFSFDLHRALLFRWRSELQKHSAAEHGLKILEMKSCSLCHKEIVARRLNEHVKQAVLRIRDPCFWASWIRIRIL
jgi:hypothetical protein